MKWYSVLLVLLCCSAFGKGNPKTGRQAQTASSDSTVHIRGRIIDQESQVAVAYVNVTVLNSETQQPITDILLGEKGDFSFAIVKNVKRFNLVVSFQGYTTEKTINLDSLAADQGGYNLGELYLPILHANELREVVVKEKSANWYSHIQRRTFPIKTLKTAEAPVLSNYLKFVPGISTMNGNVVIDGRRRPVYYLNGVVSSSTAVENLPLSMIEKIEIIANPPLSQNIGTDQAILNIITKRPQSLFLAGSLRASTSAIRGNVGESASLYLFRKDLLISLSSNAYTNRYRGVKNSSWSTGDSSPFFTQNGQSRTSVLPTFHSLSIQEKIGKNIDVSAAIRMNTLNIKHKGYQETSKGSPLKPVPDLDAIGIDRHNKDYISNLQFKYNFGTPGSVYFNAFYTRNEKDNLTETFDPLGSKTAGVRNKMLVTDKGMQANYELHKKNNTLEIGVQYNRHNSQSNATSPEHSGQGFAGGNASYSEDLISFFGTETVQIKEGMQLMIGSKVQNSAITTSINGGITTRKNKWRIYPQLSLSTATEKAGIFAVAYHRDISLPGPTFINPANQLKGVNMYVKGSNVFLPEFTNTFEIYHLIDVGEKLPVSFTNNLFLRQSHNVLSTGGNVVDMRTYNLESVYGNIGNSTIAGFDVEAKTEYKKFSIGLNGKLEYNYYDVADTKRRSGFAYAIESQSSLSITDNFSCGFELGYRNRSLSTYELGRISLPSASLSIDGSLLKKKLFFTVYWTNIFNMSNTKRYVYESMSVRGLTTEETRTQDVEISLRYSFGKSAQVAKYRGKFKSVDGRRTKE
jgi:hypothetical protein